MLPVNIHKTFLALENIFPSNNITILLHIEWKLSLVGFGSLFRPSWILKKPRRWRAATRAKFQAYTKNYWKMQKKWLLIDQTSFVENVGSCHWTINMFRDCSIIGFTVNLGSDSLGKSNDLGVSSVSRIHYGFGFIVNPDPDPIIE